MFSIGKFILEDEASPTTASQLHLTNPPAPPVWPKRQGTALVHIPTARSMVRMARSSSPFCRKLPAISVYLLVGATHTGIKKCTLPANQWGVTTQALNAWGQTASSRRLKKKKVRISISSILPFAPALSSCHHQLLYFRTWHRHQPRRRPTRRRVRHGGVFRGPDRVSRKGKNLVEPKKGQVKIWESKAPDPGFDGKIWDLGSPCFEKHTFGTFGKDSGRESCSYWWIQELLPCASGAKALYIAKQLFKWKANSEPLTAP